MFNNAKIHKHICNWQSIFTKGFLKNGSMLLNYDNKRFFIQASGLEIVEQTRC